MGDRGVLAAKLRIHRSGSHSFFVGSERNDGISTRITGQTDQAAGSVTTLLGIYKYRTGPSNTVVAITQSGVTPAALEMLGWMVRCVEENVHAGYPMDAAEYC